MSKPNNSLSFPERIFIPRYDNNRSVRHGKININSELCNGCRFCEKACPADAISIREKQAVIPNYYECMFCGDCAAICPEGAITLVEPCRYAGLYKTINRGVPRGPRINGKEYLATTREESISETAD